MKRLFPLTLLVLLAASAVGCRCHPWFNRGAACVPCAPVAPAATCDPYMAAPAATYSDLPGPP